MLPSAQKADTYTLTGQLIAAGGGNSSERSALGNCLLSSFSAILVGSAKLIDDKYQQRTAVKQFHSLISITPKANVDRNLIQ